MLLNCCLSERITVSAECYFLKTELVKSKYTWIKGNDTKLLSESHLEL